MKNNFYIESDLIPITEYTSKNVILHYTRNTNEEYECFLIEIKLPLHSPHFINE